jgi:hypothetical protein
MLSAMWSLQQLSSKLPFLMGAELLVLRGKLVVSDLDSDWTTNVLEICRLLRMAGCLK